MESPWNLGAFFGLVPWEQVIFNFFVFGAVVLAPIDVKSVQDLDFESMDVSIPGRPPQLEVVLEGSIS